MVRKPPAASLRKRDNPLPFAVVGVGASAGGFEAFSQLLEALPSHPQLTIVFVQHLAPQHNSVLPALLAGRSKLPVIQVTEGVRLKRNHVYVVPPNVQMELVAGHLHLAPRPEDRSQYTPIDFFFRSLARVLREKAIGVVLSGTASDGAAGVREIKSAGGMALAQEPASATYDGMPRAAIATQAIDLILPPAELAATLVQIAGYALLPPRVAAPQEPDPPIAEEQLDKVFGLLRQATGVNFSHYKSPTIMRRLLQRMALMRTRDIDRYIAFLEHTPGEVITLHNDLLIHVTRFFREPDSFEVLASQIIPAILATVPPQGPIRAWVAGCATSEEAYSLAITVIECLGTRIGDTNSLLCRTRNSGSIARSRAPFRLSQSYCPWRRG